MPRFAQPQQKSSTNFKRPHRSAPAVEQQGHPILHLQRTIGNQAVSRLLRAKHAGSSDSAHIATPRAVHEVSTSPGQPLDAATRAFMEPRFGQDFSHVRVHADERADRATRAVGAAAYTLGDHIAFASGRYQPSSTSGSRLLAHELAHVVQQQNSTVPHPMLQRTPLETWGGEFEADIYELSKPVRGKNEANYGANIRIIFTPNEKVNAEKIALVQTAQTLKDSMPFSVHSSDPKDVTPGRSIPDYESGQGTHIDQTPSNRTPLFGMTDPSKGNELADSTPGRYMHLGYHYSDKGGLQYDHAWLYDPARLKVADTSQGSQTFETSAVAIAGAQKGAYYGSVQWGWNKDPGALTATKITFQRISKDAPSSDFSQAAELWNKSVTSKGEDTIDLPAIAFKYTNIKTTLMDNLAKPKSLGNLDLNTKLQVTDTKGDWQNVIVIDGPLAGKTGWVKKGTLSDRQTIQPRKK